MEIAKEEFQEEVAKIPTLAKNEEERAQRIVLQASKRLDFLSFFASMFEVVDSWTSHTCAEDYARFLWLLHSRVTSAETGKLLELDCVQYCTVFETFQHEAVSHCPVWDQRYIGGVGAGSKKTIPKLSNYFFSADGRTASKVVDRNQGIISVIRSAEPVPLSCTKVRVQVGCTDGSLALYAPVDVDIGVSTVSKAERSSRPGDDACATEFCVAAPRALSEAARERCHRHQLLIGDVVELTINLTLTEHNSSNGTYGDGTMQMEVNGRFVSDEHGSPRSFDLPIVGMAHQRYHIVAAIRDPAVSLCFLNARS